MSNKVSKSVVKKIIGQAKLSSNPSDELLEKYAEQLNNVLTYIEELRSVDVGNITATDIIRTIYIDDLAEDIPYQNQDEYQRVRQNIINNFPQKQGSLLVVPVRVVE